VDAGHANDVISSLERWGSVHSLWKQKEYMDPSKAVNGQSPEVAGLNIVQNINNRVNQECWRS